MAGLIPAYAHPQSSSRQGQFRLADLITSPNQTSPSKESERPGAPTRVDRREGELDALFTILGSCEPGPSPAKEWQFGTNASPYSSPARNNFLAEIKHQARTLRWRSPERGTSASPCNSDGDGIATKRSGHKVVGAGDAELCRSVGAARISTSCPREAQGYTSSNCKGKATMVLVCAEPASGGDSLPRPCPPDIPCLQECRCRCLN